MKIQILGTGCDKCDKMMDRLTQLKKSGTCDFELEKVESLIDIMKFGVMTTPGLVIDGKLISQGKVYTVEQLEELLKKHA
ncbi:thioredoxin family protein [Proteiniclasticum sp. QWL-01]|nr:thioredoxin family protein [Proteiniclasticum sp. QWL-01]WFF72192.1 thioredoxin family protein [Proteiniclasticum sp. QWL-01]